MRILRGALTVIAMEPVWLVALVEALRRLIQ